LGQCLGEFIEFVAHVFSFVLLFCFGLQRWRGTERKVLRCIPHSPQPHQSAQLLYVQVGFWRRHVLTHFSQWFTPAFALFASPTHASAMPAKPTPNFFNAARRVTDWAKLFVSSSNLLFTFFLSVSLLILWCLRFGFSPTPLVGCLFIVTAANQPFPFCFSAARELWTIVANARFLMLRTTESRPARRRKQKDKIGRRS
jgi:hypothetical protein